MTDTVKRGLLSLGAAFLLCGALHVLLYKVDFFEGFVQFLCGAIAAVWGVSIGGRVTDRRLRRLLRAIALVLALYMVLQTVRFSFLPDGLAAYRFVWYLYYVPLTALPILSLFTALNVRRGPDERLSPLWGLVIAAGALLALGVLTNDWHAGFMAFPQSGPTVDSSGVGGWLTLAARAFISLTFIAAFLVLLRRGRGLPAGLRALPAAPLAVGLLYFILYPLGIGIRLLGVRVWNMGEAMLFSLIGTLEMCVRVGLIPANTDIGRLFPAADLDAAIVDERGTPVYISGRRDWPYPETDDLRVLSRPIAGGTVVSAVDVSRLTRLNQDLEETASRLEARNAYLAEESRVRAEQAETRARNDIYDRITRVVRPQLDRVNALLDRGDLPFDGKLRPIAVMSTYIKRRSNMELLGGGGTLPLDELAMAALEMTECLRLCGVDAAASSRGRGVFPAGVVTDAFERVEAVIEDGFDALRGLMIALWAENGALTVRLMLTADTPRGFAVDGGDAGWGYTRCAVVHREGRDAMLVVTYTPGGDGP